MPPPSPSPEYKHFCRVCNKGFTCGSALGGHMRAHGSSDEMHGVVLDDDDDESLGDEPARGSGSSDNHQRDAAGPSSSAATHAYALRANPNRLVRSCQVCKNCGREFTSWDLFLEHGRCVSDDEGGRADADDGSLRPSLSPPSDAEDDGEEDPAVAAAWSKGKRSRRVKLLTAVDEASAEPSRRCASGEEEDLANCLVMLSSSSNIEHAATVVAGTSSQQEPCAPASKERDREPQLLQPISFLAPAPEPVMALPSAAATIQYASPAPRGMFECKACKKVFTSHQALGGHRASHKKVKGCFAARFESNVVSETATSSHAATTADPTNDNGKGAAAEPSTTHAAADAKTSIYAGTDGDLNVGTSETAAALSMALVGPVVHEPPVAAAFNVAAAAAAPSRKNATKMHECSVCHRLFTSGQALGGHKRCHWLTTSSTADPTNPVANLTVPPLTEDIVGAVRHQLMLRPMADAPEPVLDLTIAAKPLPLTTAPPLVVQAEPGGSSSSSFHHLDASAPAQLHLQSPVVIHGNASHRNKTSTASGHAEGDDAAAGSTAAEDEGENSTVIKRARFTDLKDVVRMDGEATEPWLQVGIGSSSAGGDDKSARG